MSETYTKLFNTIVTSTIWQEDKDTKILWITMLAIADFEGKVEGSIPGLANLAGLSIGETKTAIDKLMAPDPYSRTKDNEGRRIAEIDGGWIILNYAKYRNKGGSRAEYYRNWRATVAQHKRNNAQQRATHTETDTDTETIKEKRIVEFDRSRKLYPGTKRGNLTEYENFQKKISDWKEVLPLLTPAIQNQIAYRAQLKAAGRFVPEWKNFKTWINNRCWEDSTPELDKESLADGKLCAIDQRPGFKYQNDKNNKPVYLCEECYSFMQGTNWGGLPIDKIREIIEARRTQ